MVFGTRPEVIKLAPVIRELKSLKEIELVTISTGQHKEMLEQSLETFGITPNVSLAVMQPNQTLNSLFSRLVAALDLALAVSDWDWVVVQGDTTTAAAAALAAANRRIKIAHVEAGLRSGDLANPFPEEGNRKMIAAFAQKHFAPTEGARQSLLREGVAENTIYVTGNTVVDSLVATAHLISERDDLINPACKAIFEPNKKVLLITSHRRENFGEGLIDICSAILHIAQSYPELTIAFPVHLNPNVRSYVLKVLQGQPGIRLLDPLDYLSMVFLLKNCFAVLTDSGGIQEEAPTFGKPVLIMRERTERTEGIQAGNAILVGTSKVQIVSGVRSLLESQECYTKMANARNPYGDGTAAKQIARILRA